MEIRFRNAALTNAAEGGRIALKADESLLRSDGREERIAVASRSFNPSEVWTAVETGRDMELVVVSERRPAENRIPVPGVSAAEPVIMGEIFVTPGGKSSQVAYFQ